MRPEPTSIELQPNRGIMEIDWNDGRRTRHSMNDLRRNCPCATCQAERQKLEKPGPVLRVIEGPVTTEAVVVDYRPVGRYALGFTWNDGHSSGIYSYDFILKHQLK